MSREGYIGLRGPRDCGPTHMALNNMWKGYAGSVNALRDNEQYEEGRIPP